MGVVIDVNVLPCVFNPNDSSHSDFEPVLKWIDKGAGVMVVGGTRYRAEVGKLYRYAGLLKLHRDRGNVVHVCDDMVDARVEVVTAETCGTGCDDQHIIALLDVSRCQLLCSHDERSYQFVQDRILYASPLVVKIYKRAEHEPLIRRFGGARLRNLQG